MLRKILIVFALSFLSQTFVAQSGVNIYDSIVSGGIQRKFRLYIPNSYNASTAAPLVFNLHGYTSNSAQQMPYANFMPIADTAKFLIVSPDGTVFNGAQFWNAGFGGTVNDVQFISDLIDSIGLNYNIDLNAVYSCGMSNGGIMSYYLACNLPNRITAIASVTGAMLNPWFGCTPSPTRAFPVMEIHGTSDGTVPYNGNAQFSPIDTIIKKWRVYNNCNPSPTTFSVPDIVTSDNSTAIHYKYTGGINGSSVELFKVINGSHSWPGALPVIANTNQDFSASKEIWRFFRQYKLSHFIPNVSIKEQNSINENLSLYPNPSHDIINISVKADKIEISDIRGRIVKNDSYTSVINVSDLEPGIYFIKVQKDASSKNLRFIKD
ncbi:MAG: hypothetical protein K0S32_3798 [Bacteroidetes bacterium]|nr:hypothetical protein [Bacteroidota bacterium]